nr:DUF4386 domain-containing protein [uncultured Actinoplanes sp.]
MTTTTRTRPAPAVHTTTAPGRTNVRVSGIFYLITFVSSIPALLLLSPVLNDPGFILGAGSATAVRWGGLLDFVNALAGVGTAVAVFPVVKRYHESLALGFVATRLIEAAVIMTGVVSLLAVVTLRTDAAGGVGTGQALVAVRDWTFLFGPGFMACLNAALFGTLLLRARLVPRIIPAVGLIGAPLLLAANVATVFGHNAQVSGVSMLATLPVAGWELAIGVWMVVKGLRTTDDDAPPAR